MIGRHDESLKSMYQLFENSWKKDNNHICLGTKVKEGNCWEYKWKTYDEIRTLVQIIANAMTNEKLTKNVKDPDFGVSIDAIGIISENREEWLVTDLACNLIDATSVPLYETLGDDMLKVILQ